MSGLDDFDRDFGTRSRPDIVRERITAGQSRRSIAFDLGISLELVNRAAQEAVLNWSGEAGTTRQRLVAVHWGLDALTDRISAELDAGGSVSELGALLARVYELRSRLLLAERQPGPRPADAS